MELEESFFDKYIKEQKEKLHARMHTEKSNRGKSAHALASLALASLALAHVSTSAGAAASLLLAMQNGTRFDFKDLLSFDSENREHADVIISGYIPHDTYPSKWLDYAGYDGEEIIKSVWYKWGEEI